MSRLPLFGSFVLVLALALPAASQADNAPNVTQVAKLISAGKTVIDSEPCIGVNLLTRSLNALKHL